MLSALLTPVIAVLAVYIAYQQYLTNKQKLRLDLYDKRFKVFLALMSLLSSIMRQANVKQEELAQYNADTNESVFLFDEELVGYLRLVRKEAVRLMNLKDKLYNSDLPVGEERSQCAAECSQVLSWLLDQFEVSQKTFAKYLAFKE